MELTRQARDELIRVAGAAEIETGEVLRLRVEQNHAAYIEKGRSNADDRLVVDAHGLVLVADAALALMSRDCVLHYVRESGPLGQGKRWVLLSRRGGATRPGLATSVVPSNKEAIRNDGPVIPRLLSAVLNALR